MISRSASALAAGADRLILPGSGAGAS